MRPASFLSLRVLSPEGSILEKDELTAINVPLVNGGAIGIRPGHAPLIAETARGIVQYRTKSGREFIEIHPGVLDIRDNLVSILTAGEVSQTPDIYAESEETEFDRLMSSLSKQLVDDKEFEKDTIKK